MTVLMMIAMGMMGKEMTLKAKIGASSKPNRRVFVDTSAYLVWTLNQAGAAEIEKQLTGASLFASSILFIEAERALLQLTRTKILNPTQGIMLRESLVAHASYFTVREPSLELSLSNRFPAVTTPKSADLIHLRTALWFHENEALDLFLTTNKQQAIAAAEFGMPVY